MVFSNYECGVHYTRAGQGGRDLRSSFYVVSNLIFLNPNPNPKPKNSPIILSIEGAKLVSIT